MGTTAAGERIRDDGERAWFMAMHARAAEEAAGGWYVDWKLRLCVGRKGERGGGGGAKVGRSGREGGGGFGGNGGGSADVWI